MTSNIVSARNVVMIGPIPSQNPKNKLLFETVKESCKKKNFSLYTPLDLTGMKLEDKELYNQVSQAIMKCDFVIVDISSTQQDMNLGIGILIATAHFYQKSIIVLAKSQTNLSLMMQGLSSVSKIIFYENMEELSSSLDDYLNYGKFRK